MPLNAMALLLPQQGYTSQLKAWFGGHGMSPNQYTSPL